MPHAKFGPDPLKLWPCIRNRDGDRIVTIHSVTSLHSRALTLLVGRQEGHPACKKIEWWGAGVVIYLERSADLHTAQLMPLPLTVSCFSKIQIGFTFLVPTDPGSPGQINLHQSTSSRCVYPSRRPRQDHRCAQRQGPPHCSTHSARVRQARLRIRRSNSLEQST